MKLLQSIMTVCCLLLSFGAQAELFENDHLLVTIKSEPEGGLVHELILTTDELNEIMMFTRTSNVSTEDFPIEQILREPVILARAKGKDAVRLSCSDCNPIDGGRVYLSYLFNGITNRYKRLALDLFIEDGEWFLAIPGGEVVNTLTLKSKKLFGQVIGVGRIEVNKF